MSPSGRFETYNSSSISKNDCLEYTLKRPLEMRHAINGDFLLESIRAYAGTTVWLYRLLVESYKGGSDGPIQEEP